MKIHYRNIRLFNNAGMDFPECCSNPKSGLLDLDKGRLLTSGSKAEVTCIKCRRKLNDK